MPDAATPALSARHTRILIAAVEQYIATGEPVASQSIAHALSAAEPVSPATVRNAMVELAAAGYLEQPHTSAGRIPTARAFRLYVEQLSHSTPAHPAAIHSQAFHSQAFHTQIDRSFVGVDSPQSFLERTPHVLAALAGGVGVALTPAPAAADTLEHVHFSRLAPRRVLAVVVLSSGLVRDRALTLDTDLDAPALESAANFLNHHYRGQSITAIRDDLARRLDAERSELQRLVAAAGDLWQRSMPAAPAAPRQLYVEGVANLIGSEADRHSLHAMLAALEEKQRLINLLTAYVDARQDSVRVVFDLDEHAPEMRDLVLIAAPATLSGTGRGAVAVIGHQRMHYQRAMDAVGYIAHLFDRVLHS